MTDTERIRLLRDHLADAEGKGRNAVILPAAAVRDVADRLDRCHCVYCRGLICPLTADDFFSRVEAHIRECPSHPLKQALDRAESLKAALTDEVAHRLDVERKAADVEKQRDEFAAALRLTDSARRSGWHDPSVCTCCNAGHGMNHADGCAVGLAVALREAKS